MSNIPKSPIGKLLLHLIGLAVFEAYHEYLAELESHAYLTIGYGRNHKTNILRAIVEYKLLKVGRSGIPELGSEESNNKSESSAFVLLHVRPDLKLTVFRLQQRNDFPKVAQYRNDYAFTNQLNLFDRPSLEIPPPSYGIICIGVDRYGFFAFIGYPDYNNNSWLLKTDLMPYFMQEVVQEEIVMEPKLRLKEQIKRENG